MGLINKKLDTCPICDAGVARGAMMSHNLTHATPSPDGQGGFVWICKCGEKDGVWDQAPGAAAGLTQHMTRRHGITWP